MGKLNNYLFYLWFRKKLRKLTDKYCMRFFLFDEYLPHNEWKYMKLVDLVEMKFKETIKETPCICVYCLVPHTLSPSRRLNSESQTHWSSGLTLSLKKKVKIQNIEFLQMSNAFQLLSSYFRLFAWQHVLCCITEFLQQKNVHSVLQSFLLFFRMCHSCKPVSHPHSGGLLLKN